MTQLTPRPGPRHGPLEMREPKLALWHPGHRRVGGQNRQLVCKLAAGLWREGLLLYGPGGGP